MLTNAYRINGNVQEGTDDYTSMVSLFTKAEPQIQNSMDTLLCSQLLLYNTAVLTVN